MLYNYSVGIKLSPEWQLKFICVLYLKDEVLTINIWSVTKSIGNSLQYLVAYGISLFNNYYSILDTWIIYYYYFIFLYFILIISNTLPTISTSFLFLYPLNFAWNVYARFNFTNIIINKKWLWAVREERGTGKSRGREKHHQDVLYEKNYFNKRKK